MEKVSIQIFTSPTCIYCPAVLQIVKEIEKERSDVAVKEHNVMTAEGRQKALQYSIERTPTVLVSGPNYNEILGYTSPSKSDLIEAIEVVNGGKELPRQKGFLQSIKEIFGL